MSRSPNKTIFLIIQFVLIYSSIFCSKKEFKEFERTVPKTQPEEEFEYKKEPEAGEPLKGTPILKDGSVYLKGHKLGIGSDCFSKYVPISATYEKDLNFFNISMKNVFDLEALRDLAKKSGNKTIDKYLEEEALKRLNKPIDTLWQNEVKKLLDDIMLENTKEPTPTSPIIPKEISTLEIPKVVIPKKLKPIMEGKAPVVLDINAEAKKLEYDTLLEKGMVEFNVKTNLFKVTEKAEAYLSGVFGDIFDKNPTDASLRWSDNDEITLKELEQRYSQGKLDQSEFELLDKLKGRSADLDLLKKYNEIALINRLFSNRKETIVMGKNLKHMAKPEYVAKLKEAGENAEKMLGDVEMSATEKMKWEGRILSDEEKTELTKLNERFKGIPKSVLAQIYAANISEEISSLDSKYDLAETKGLEALQDKKHAADLAKKKAKQLVQIGANIKKLKVELAGEKEQEGKARLKNQISALEAERDKIEKKATGKPELKFKEEDRLRDLQSRETKLSGKEQKELTDLRSRFSSRDKEILRAQDKKQELEASKKRVLDLSETLEKKELYEEVFRPSENKL